MATINEIFIRKIKETIPPNISITEEIASILDVNYDAAYRRISGKVHFSLSEAIILSKKFDISLNALYQVNEPNSYLIRESRAVNSLEDIKEYLSRLGDVLSPYANREDASILFGTRELPLFYFLRNPILARFKIYSWLNILNINAKKRITFDNFDLSNAMYKCMRQVGRAYNKINLTEVWGFGTINNALQQILYLYRMQLINRSDAHAIANALIEELEIIKGKTLIKNPNTKFELYSNELIMMNNSVVLKLKNTLRFGYPYALLRFFMIDNQDACKAQEKYIKEQMKHATCISNTSIKEHTNFFNQKFGKINQMLKVIDNEEDKPLFL